nr:ribonuclease H-like domain-containing protein [Tanacetum cinerariifolium]
MDCLAAEITWGLSESMDNKKNEHYALWEVIELGDSNQAPLEETSKGSASESSAKKKGRTVSITTKDMQKRRNDIKTFGGNKATKMTKKNQLKQQYGNFKAEGSETLEQTFNRLQAIVSHLEFIDVEIEQDDLNQMFLTSLAPEWLIGKGKVHTASVPTASTQVSTTSTDVAAASISHDTVCAYIASQSNARFWKKTCKKITIQGSDVAGFNKSKVECFNCHKMGHFARECRAPRSQDRGKRESYRQGPKEEEQAPKALMDIDGIGWDWSYMANEEENHAHFADEEVPTKFALMAKSSSSLENKVEARLVEFKSQEIKFCEKIRGLERNVEVRNNKIENLLNELERVKNEKEGLDNKLTGFESALKDLDTLLGSQRTNKNKEGLPEFADDTVTDYSMPTPSIDSSKRNTSDLQNSNPSVFEHGESSSSIMSKPIIKFVKAADSPKVIKTNKTKTARKSPIKYAVRGILLLGEFCPTVKYVVRKSPVKYAVKLMLLLIVSTA